jgi:glucosyl-3-phosphoglycerate synthase
MPTGPAHHPAGTFDRATLAARDVSVAAVLVARDESATIGAALEPLAGLLTDGLLDDLVVIDGGSTDGTVELATGLGARVVDAASVLPRFGPVLGKGDSMWRTLAAVDTDVVAFLDADLQGAYDEFVIGLLGPLVVHRGARFVKGCFRRIRSGEEAPRAFDGGRVTELVARPLLNLLRPDLARFYQPLGGQIAARTADLRSIPVLTGYAVEISMLAEVVDRFGADVVVESDLGTVVNRERTFEELVPMSQEVLFGLLRRTEHDLVWVPYTRPLPDGDGVSAPERHHVVRRPPIDAIDERY